MTHHVGGQGRGMGEGLDVEVTEHFVRFPPTNQADDVGVDAGAEQGHGAAGAETAGRNAVGVEIEGRSRGGGGCAQGLGNGMAANGQPGVGLPNHVERGGGGGVVGAKVENAANEGKDRTGKLVA